MTAACDALEACAESDAEAACQRLAAPLSACGEVLRALSPNGNVFVESFLEQCPVPQAADIRACLLGSQAQGACGPLLECLPGPMVDFCGLVCGALLTCGGHSIDGTTTDECRRRCEDALSLEQIACIALSADMGNGCERAQACAPDFVPTGDPVVSDPIDEATCDEVCSRYLPCSLPPDEVEEARDFCVQFCLANLDLQAGECALAAQSCPEIEACIAQD